MESPFLNDRGKPKFKQEFEQHHVVVNNLSLNYTLQGDGPPALFLHGYAHTGAMWGRPVREYLQTHYRCYALDLPGHGHSTKPPLDWFSLENFTQTIYGFCRQLELDQILLIGYSMGGLIAIDLTRRYPALVDRLVIINAPIKGNFLRRYDLLLRLEPLARRPIARRFHRLYYSSPLFSIPVELRRYADRRMLWRESCRQVRRQMALCPVEALFGCLKTIRQTDLTEATAHLPQPMLAIASDQDRVVPPAQARFVAGQAPQAQLAVITNCGHLPLDEQPAQFDSALKQFLGLD